MKQNSKDIDEAMKWWESQSINERQNLRWWFGNPTDGYMSEEKLIEVYNKYQLKSKQNFQKFQSEQKPSGVWVKASERLPEKGKIYNGKLNGKPAIVWESKLLDGYVTANGNIERVTDVEWLDESQTPSVWVADILEQVTEKILKIAGVHGTPEKISIIGNSIVLFFKDKVIYKQSFISRENTEAVMDESTQKPLTNAEIEALAEKEYPFDGMCKIQLVRAFKTGYKVALKLL